MLNAVLTVPWILLQLRIKFEKFETTQATESSSLGFFPTFTMWIVIFLALVFLETPTKLHYDLS